MTRAFGDDEALFDAIMAGAAGYVLKQIRGTDLVGAAAPCQAAWGSSAWSLSQGPSALPRDRPPRHHGLARLHMEVPVGARPHDVTDLYLSPVVLAVDARIEELGRLGKDQLDYEVALESDLPDLTRSMREEALIRTVTHLIDRHGWEFSWDPRGLRLSHDAHTLVLGIPAAFVKYLEGSPTALAT